MRFRCPHCQAESEVHDCFQGQRGLCWHCGAPIVVPGTGTVPGAGTSAGHGIPGRQRLAAVVRAGLSAGLFAAACTLLLLTLPAYGSLGQLVHDVIQPQSLSVENRRQLIGHGILWITLTAVGGVLGGLLAGLLGLRSGGAARLDAGCRGAGWGCGLASLAAIGVLLLLGWLGGWFLSPLQLAGRLLVIFLCGMLGAGFGIWRAEPD